MFLPVALKCTIEEKKDEGFSLQQNECQVLRANLLS